MSSATRDSWAKNEEVKVEPQKNPKAPAATLNDDGTRFAAEFTPHVLEPTVTRSTGKVVDRDGARLIIRSAGKTITAHKSVSCLVQPVVEDVVALLQTTEGVFVTDILIRSDEHSDALKIDLHRTDGSPQDAVLSAGSLRLEAEDKLEASGKKLGFKFENILMSGSRIALVGERLMTSMQEIVSQACKVLATYDMTSTRAKNRVDTVSDTDQLKAGAIQTQAETVAITQAGSSIIVAKEDVRMDGKRITMG